MATAMKERSYQNLSEFKLPPNYRGRSKIYVQIWWLVQLLLFRPSPQVCYGWRNYLLRLFGAKIGKGVLVRPTVTVTYPWKLEIGDYSWIGDDAVLYTLDRIRIGSNSVVSQRSYLCTGMHDYTRPTFDLQTSPITVEDEVWIASDTFVMPGITIRHASVVAARSLVTRDTSPAMVHVGSPAKPVRNRQTADSPGKFEEVGEPVSANGPMGLF
jgi:putative colanic acid biosynthesis acetyltransferase WcaF